MNNKRSFLKTLFGLPLLGFNYKVTAKQPEKLVLLNQFPIAGFNS